MRDFLRYNVNTEHIYIYSCQKTPRQSAWAFPRYNVTRKQHQSAISTVSAGISALNWRIYYYEYETNTNHHNPNHNYI